jgi:hypothetical protein
LLSAPIACVLLRLAGAVAHHVRPVIDGDQRLRADPFHEQEEVAEVGVVRDVDGVAARA